MSEAMPSTPQNPRPAVFAANRRLWTSPSISDYFSGDDASSWSLSPETSSVLKSGTTSFEGPRASSPDSLGGRTLQNSIHDSQLSPTTRRQQQLLRRLNSIGRSILTSDFDDEQCLKLDADVDRVEATISAPESQSREPAEDEVTGLFNDDATESSTIVQGPAINNHEASQLVQRVVKAAAQLKQRFLEIQHTNDLTTAKLEAAAQEISQLREQNDALRNNDSQSEILYLRLRLNALEERAKSHLDRRGQEDLVSSIQELNLASSPPSTRPQPDSKTIQSPVMPGTVFVNDSRAGDGLGYRVARGRVAKAIPTSAVYSNGQITPIDESALEAAGAESVKAEHAQVEDDELSVDHSLSASQTMDSAVETSPDDLQEEQTPVRDEIDETPDIEAGATEDLIPQLGKEDEPATPDTKPQKQEKSAWQMLWDELAEFSGIRQDLDDDYDDE